jgi:CheY-like chemotaxis protein
MPAKPLLITMVDDDAEDLELFGDAIQSHAPHIVIHNEPDGPSALEYFKSRKDKELPSLILVDYNMPGMSGADVVAALSAEDRYKKIPKVVLSTAADPVYEAECTEKGAAMFITKPLTMPGVHKVAKQLLELYL